MKHSLRVETTSASLHVMAMAFMLCDHLWGAGVLGWDWLTCVGRIAFPIFAFLLVEGFFHTSSRKKYAGRLLLFAVLSELPFNLVMGGSPFYPLHQNVLWSFLIAFGLLSLNERARLSGKGWLRVLTGLGTVVLGYLLGLLTMVDFYHAGILTVLVFYFFRGRRWWCYAGQLLCLAYINIEILSGFAYELTLLGQTFYFPRQGLALLALIPIWLYRGRQGHHSKAFQLACYAFYPVHLLILGLISLL